MLRTQQLLRSTYFKVPWPHFSSLFTSQTASSGFCTSNPYVSEACMCKWPKGRFGKAIHCQRSLRIHLIQLWTRCLIFPVGNRLWTRKVHILFSTHLNTVRGFPNWLSAPLLSQSNRACFVLYRLSLEWGCDYGNLCCASNALYKFSKTSRKSQILVVFLSQSVEENHALPTMSHEIKDIYTKLQGWRRKYNQNSKVLCTIAMRFSHFEA